MRRLLLLAAILAAVLTSWLATTFLAREPQDVAERPLPDWELSQRPQGERYLYDYARILTHFEEGVQRYLDQIASNYHIEAVILTLPAVPPDLDIERLVSLVINQWRIGADFDGRAVLLVLVHDRHQVRMEVGYQLEDVFTDAFVGHVEDKQLAPYFLNEDVGTGLIALMEELERRAELKHQGDYTPGLIAGLDADFISGGGGAERDLTRYRQQPGPGSELPVATARGARTPEEAWRTLLKKWAGHGAGLDIEVYTELSKMAMGDPHRPDPRTKEALPHWRNAKFEVLRDDQHAVIYFGSKKGWNNAPFLFCRDREGWKFDIVYQRRLVVMGSGKSWYVAQGRFPYVSLLQQVPQSMGKDLPLSAGDLYHCSDDATTAARIRALSAKVERPPFDYADLRELMRLNVVTGRRPNYVRPLLERAKTLAPDDPLPYKYSAIYNVNTFFQYKTALRDIDAYLGRGGDPVFGFNFKGFLHYRLKQYEKAVAALEKVIVETPDDVYALSLLARVHGLLYLSANTIDPRRAGFQTKAVKYLLRAQNVISEDYVRVTRVANWMKKNGLLP